jgi:hypothetical protein
LCLFLAPTPPAAAIADDTNQQEEQTMIIRDYLMKVIQDDARRAGERDRLLREARRARRARRRAERGKIILSGNVTLDGVIQDPAGDEGFRPAAGLSSVPPRSRREPDDGWTSGQGGRSATSPQEQRVPVEPGSSVVTLSSGPSGIAANTVTQAPLVHKY